MSAMERVDRVDWNENQDWACNQIHTYEWIWIYVAAYSICIHETRKFSINQFMIEKRTEIKINEPKLYLSF